MGAVDIGIGPFVDETDGKTAETALTITQADIDPATGRGYKDATFGYTIPYLATTQTAGTAAATTRTEEFDDEDLRNQLGSEFERHLGIVDGAQPLFSLLDRRLVF
jgi:hypothetical protein